MSLTVQQIVMDAKNLASKLKDSNSAADALLSQGQSVHRQIDTMKQYADEVGELNELAKHRPHAALVAGIQQENRHLRDLRDLQQENRELKAALEEQQNALELIMSKYRQQITKLAHSSQIDLTKLYNKNYMQIIIDQAIKISEMTHIMGKAVQADEDGILKTEEELHRLATENQVIEGLRELLCISSKYDSISIVKEPDSSN